ncbi:tetratricopeptide repeat protein 12-like [Sitophilus oryzae]|uniref:Tetratricopeptide repeat protein 12-like n=1 Tax=Sitophilus oryzae TaxID=7048 RepID=A0A6J2Y4E7_SITOR|nr:tetratricopeptide repeat protein 12-like [Sitophilus oryzae]
MELSKNIPPNVINNSEDINEEFNNFMQKVNEVNRIVKNLASKDKDVQKRADEEARRYLGEDKEILHEHFDEENVSLTVSSSKTLVNRKALEDDKNRNPDEMSKEAFMDEMSRDADRRYKEKQIRREKMETLKKQATLAFRRGEYEKALVLYNKAIDQIKDSVTLYNNRALTYIKLGFLDKAKHDLTEWALRINGDCLKSWLLLAKVNFLDKKTKEYENSVFEAKTKTLTK